MRDHLGLVSPQRRGEEGPYRTGVGTPGLFGHMGEERRNRLGPIRPPARGRECCGGQWLCVCSSVCRCVGGGVVRSFARVVHGRPRCSRRAALFTACLVWGRLCAVVVGVCSMYRDFRIGVLSWSGGWPLGCLAVLRFLIFVLRCPNRVCGGVFGTGVEDSELSGHGGHQAHS